MTHGSGLVIYSPSLDKYFKDDGEFKWHDVENSFTNSDVADASFYKMQRTVIDKILSLVRSNPSETFVIRKAFREIFLEVDEDDINPETAIRDEFQEQIDAWQIDVDMVDAMSNDEVNALSKSTWEAHRTQKRALKELKYYISDVTPQTQ